MTDRKDSIELEIFVPLTEEDEKDYSSKLVEAILSKERIEIELKNFTKEKRDEIVGQQSLATQYTKILSRKKHLKIFTCDVKIDWEKKMKYYIDTTSGEIIREAELTTQDYEDEANKEGKI